MDPTRSGRTGEIAAVLVGVYCFLLVAIPADAGLTLSGFVLTPPRAVLLVILLGCAVLAWANRWTPERAHWLPIVAWGAFLAIALIGSLMSPLGGHIARIASLAVEGAVLWLIVATLGRNAITRRSAEAGLLIGTGVLAFGALLSLALAGISGDAAAWTDMRFGFVRQGGSFTAPLFFGIWLVAASVIALAWAERASGPRRWALLGLWLLFAAAAVATASRISITGVMAVAAAFLLIRGRYVTGSLAASGALLVAVGFALISQPLPQPPVGPSPTPSSGLSPTPQAGGSQSPAAAVESARPAPRPGTIEYESEWLAGSNALRVEALHLTLQAVQQRPIIGWGVLNAQPASAVLIGHVNYVDSSYLLLLIETGLLGTLAMAGVFLAYLRLALRTGGTASGLARTLALLALVSLSAVAAFLGEPQGYALTSVVGGLACASSVSPLFVRRSHGLPGLVRPGRST